MKPGVVLIFTGNKIVVSFVAVTGGLLSGEFSLLSAPRAIHPLFTYSLSPSYSDVRGPWAGPLTYSIQKGSPQLLKFTPWYLRNSIRVVQSKFMRVSWGVTFESRCWNRKSSLLKDCRCNFRKKKRQRKHLPRGGHCPKAPRYDWNHVMSYIVIWSSWSSRDETASGLRSLTIIVLWETLYFYLSQNSKVKNL